MPKFRSIVTAASLALCSAHPAAAKTDAGAAAMVPREARARAVLVMGTNNLIPPMSYMDSSNRENIGLEPDLAREIASRIGMQLRIENVPFDALMIAMRAKRFDFVMASLNDSLERRRFIDAVDYLDGSDVLVVKGGNPLHIGRPADICGLSVGALTASEGERDFDNLSRACVKAGKPLIDIKRFKTPGATDLALLAGRVAATDQSAPRALYTVRMSNGRKEIVPGGKVSGSKKSIQLQKGSPLLPAFTRAMQGIVADGTYKRLLEKYGLAPLAVSNITVNDAHVK